MVLADDEDELLVLVGADGALVDDQRRLAPGLAHAQAHELAGHQRAVLVVEDRPDADGAGRGIDAVVDEVEMAGDRRGLVRRGGHLHRDAPEVARLAGLGRQRRQRLEQRALIGVEAGIDRIDRDQRRQQRCIGAGGDEIADGDLQPADATADRGADLGVVEVEPCRLQSGASGALVGLRLAQGVEPGVEVALRDVLRRHQLLAAFMLARSERDAGLGGQQLRLGALELGLVGRLVDADEQVALLDQRALREMHLLDDARDA